MRLRKEDPEQLRRLLAPYTVTRLVWVLRLRHR